MLLASSFSLAALRTTSPPDVTAAALSVVAGTALLLALHARRWPNWLRADCAVVSVGLYAVAFAFIGVIGEDVAGQTVAYAVGFLLASTLEPLTGRRASAPEALDVAEEQDSGSKGL